MTFNDWQPHEPVILLKLDLKVLISSLVVALLKDAPAQFAKYPCLFADCEWVILPSYPSLYCQ